MLSTAPYADLVEVDHVVPWSVSADDRAFAALLAAEYRAEDAELVAVAETHGWLQPHECEPASLTADEQVEALSGPAHEMDLPLLAGIAPTDLSSDLVRVRYLQALDRVAALVASLRADALVALAGAESTGAYLSEVAVEHEVAVARRTSRHAAGRAIEVARGLRTTFPAFARALRAGEISEAHCSLLVDRTRVVVDDAALAALEARLLPRARRLPVGRFGREVARAIAALDPEAVARHRRARETRTVYSRPLEDGLGFLGLVHDWATISAIQATVDADAAHLRLQRGGATAVVQDGDEDARLGACRADALAARLLGAVADDGTVTWNPHDSVRVSLDLVIDLDTLRGEVEREALLDGQPIPADAARELVDAVRTWRRVVTDPVDGHLLDYGTRQYLPDRLRRFVFARDGECLAPDCAVRSPRRLQLDHVVPFPDGPSSAANTDTKCTVCHQLKTAGHLGVADASADGSRTWTTAWGQRVHIPARAFLHDPTDESGAPALAPPEPLVGGPEPPEEPPF